MQKDLHAVDIGIIIKAEGKTAAEGFLYRAFNTERGDFPLIAVTKPLRQGAFVKIQHEDAFAIPASPADRDAFTSFELAYLNDTANTLTSCFKAVSDRDGKNGKAGLLRHKLRVAAVSCGLITDPVARAYRTTTTFTQRHVHLHGI